MLLNQLLELGSQYKKDLSLHLKILGEAEAASKESLQEQIEIEDLKEIASKAVLQRGDKTKNIKAISNRIKALQEEKKLIKESPEFVIADNLPKINPKSAARETGGTVGTRGDIAIGLTSKKGGSVEAAAEYFGTNGELEGLLGYDAKLEDQDIRGIIIEILIKGKKKFKSDILEDVNEDIKKLRDRKEYLQKQKPVTKAKQIESVNNFVEKEIKKEKEEVEKIQWELEMERVEIALEKDRLERRKFKLAEDRLRALRKQRKTLEDSILKMSEEMTQDIEMPTMDRKQRRITMENEYLNQIEFEESAVQEYIPTLFRAEEVLPDVMTTDSQISSTVDPIEFMDEKALMRLKIKHMRADQCRSRTHKMYKLFLESTKDPEQREELEQMLLATIKNIDKKMGKFKSELDSYDQKEQFILARSEQAQAEQERALKEQGDLKKTLEGLQDQQRTTAEELNNLQKEKEEADKKQAALKERINEERKVKIQKEQRLEEERLKLKALEKEKREREEINKETEKLKKMREERDRDLAKKIEEQERKERERQDKEIAKKLQEKQKREKEEQDRMIAEELERERKEEEMKRRQRIELARIEKEHQDLLDKERKAKERRKTSKKGVKPTKEEQKTDKEELINTIGEIVNGHKPKKPKDLGWDYQKDKEAKRVFERKKELQKIRKAELEKMSNLCLECRYPKHPGECPCKICGRRGHKEEECPILKPPTAPEPEVDFCPECMKAHPPGQCICKLCKTQGHLEADCPWLREAEAQANIKLPLGEREEKEPEVQICLHCRSNTHRMEDCAAYKAAQARMKEDWCYGCRQYGHTIVECMDEKQEERNKEIEKEIEKRKKQLEEIDKKMERIKSGIRKDERKVPEDRDTRDYPRKLVESPKPGPEKRGKSLNPHSHPLGRTHLKAPQSEELEEEENHQEMMILVNQRNLKNQTQVMMMRMMRKRKNPIVQKLQRSQNSYMMREVEGLILSNYISL